MATAKVIFLAVIFGLAVYVGWTLVDYGSDRTRNAVERQNNEAARSADDDRLSFDDCPDGMWSFEAGECERAP